MGYRVKRPAISMPPPELLTFDPESWLPPGGDSDPWWATRAHALWCAARADWCSTRSWPTGKDQRKVEEAIVTPDEPLTVWDGPTRR